MSPAQQNKQFTSKDAKARVLETLAHLRRLGGGALTEETGIAYHDGKQILLPEGMALKTGAKLLTAQAISMEEIHAFTKVFRYRPYDGAYNLQEVLKEIFGLSGTGKAIHTLFGVQPPRYVSVEVNKDQEVRVPWGHIDFPLLEGCLHDRGHQRPDLRSAVRGHLPGPQEVRGRDQRHLGGPGGAPQDQQHLQGQGHRRRGQVSKEGVSAPSFLDAYAIDPRDGRLQADGVRPPGGLRLGPHAHCRDPACRKA
jgi:hypothetical protein